LRIQIEHKCKTAAILEIQKYSNNIHICCIPTASFHYGNWRAKGHVLWILTNHGDVMPSSSHMHGKKHHEIHLDTYQYTEIPHGKMRPKAGSLILWTTLVWTGRPWCTCSGPSHLLRVYMCTACDKQCTR